MTICDGEAIDFQAPVPIDSLSTAVELARRLVGGDRASLMLLDEEAAELRIAAASGLPPAVATSARVRLGDSVAGVVAQTQQPMMVNDRDTRRTSPGTASYRTGSFISVPVPLQGAICGVLNVADPVAGPCFRADDLAALQSFADYIAHDLTTLPAQHRIEQLQDVVAQLRRQTIQAQEDERRRVAWDLHDEAGHALTAAIFRLDLEMTQLPPEATVARTALDRARASLLECASTLHSIAFALRPRILEDLGLGAALRSLAAQTMESDSVQVVLTIEGEGQQLDEAVELTIFRIVQEALTNVRKHARARQAWVRVTYGSPELRVTIEDDGVGLDTLNMTPRRQSGLGLVGMFERLEAHGGSLEIGGREVGGVRLVARLPLQ